MIIETAFRFPARLALGAALVALACGLSACSSDAEGGPAAPLEPCTAGLNCPGTAAPAWALADFQPKSAKFGQTYGLEAFRGKVVIVALLAGWCSFCQSQTVELQKMSEELVADGVNDVVFVTINGIDAADDQGNLTSRCAFPLFQDVTAIGAWRLHGGIKDDMFVYGRDGTLRSYIPINGEVQADLSKAKGYAYVKGKILAAR